LLVIVNNPLTQGGYFLKGYGTMLNMALVQYGMQFLFKRGYTPMQTPFFMKKEIMAETCQLSDFDETLYKLGSGETTEEKDESFLIATSEQPISGYFRGEWVNTEELPIRFAGFSTCFRKEAGSHGKDMWGIFRVHQFEKIEQFCITDKESSKEEHEKMCKISEEFLQSLGLPYRVNTRPKLRLLALLAVPLTTQQAKSMISKPGSLAMVNSKN